MLFLDTLQLESSLPMWLNYREKFANAVYYDVLERTSSAALLLRM